MADDWVKLGISVGASLISGAAGMIAGVWRAGRDSSKREQSVKDDYDAKIKSLGDEMRKALADHERASEARLDLLVGQFQESFSGLRRQFDSARLETERDFMRKEDFRDFREEYRQDIRDIKSKIDNIQK